MMDMTKLSRHAMADQMQAARNRYTVEYFDGPPALTSDDEAAKASFARWWLGNRSATIAILAAKIKELRTA